MSNLHIKDLLTKYGEDLSFDYVRFLIGTINYGGRIVDQKDHILINILLDDFFSDNVLLPFHVLSIV